MYHCTIFRLMDSFMERRASEDQNNGARRNHPASAKHFEICGAVCGALWSLYRTQPISKGLSHPTMNEK